MRRIILGGVSAGVLLVGTTASHAQTTPRPNQEPARIVATNGETIDNSDTIIADSGGTAILLLSTGADDVVTGNNSGELVVAGGTTVDRTYGLIADGAGARGNLRTDTTLRLTGNGAVGTQAVNGGTITVAAGVNPVFASDAVEQIGFEISKLGSSILTAPGTLEANGTRATLFRIDSGGQRSFDGTTVLVASGTNSRAIVGAFDGTSVTLTGAQIQVSGSKASGLVLFGESSGTADAATSIVISGAGTGANINARPGLPDGSMVPADTVRLTSAAAITGAGDGAHGYYVTNGGTLTHTGAISLSGQGTKGIEVLGSGASVTHSGTIALTGTGTGVEIGRVGRLVNTGAVTVASGIGVLIRDAGSTLTGVGSAPVTANDGIAALQVIRGGAVDTTANFIANGTAHGVLVDVDAGPVSLGAGTITTGGTGNALENAANSSAILLRGTTLVANGSGAAVRTGVALDPASSATLGVAGANSTGFDFSGRGGSGITGDLTLGTNYAITASGVGARGVRANTSGNVAFTGRVDVINAGGGSALVAGPAAQVTNSGALVSVSTTTAVVDLTGGARAFTNTGTITAGSSTATAIAGGNNGQAVTLSAGPVTGAIVLGAGNDTFLMTGGTLGGALDAGGGNDTAIFRGLTDANMGAITGISGSGSASGSDTLVFDATTSTGTRRLTGWNAINVTNGSTLTSDGDLTLANGTVTIDAGSTFFAGNGVRGAITAATGGTATLVNAGIIDLTNGTSGATDTLTVRGNYVGQNGVLRLQTVLAGDGAPSDRLVIDGGAVSGTTSIQISNAGGLGAQTTGNGIEVVSAINGGTTTATTTGTGFTLAGGQVDAGAFEYRLFASDQAGTSQSWFLRTQGSGQTEEPTPPDPDPTFRVDAPLLVALPNALRGGDLAMLGTYHKRMGDETRPASLGRSAGRLWGRAIAEDGRFRQDGVVRPTTNGELYGLQIGVDLLHHGSDAGRHSFGVYGGYTDGNLRVRGFASGVENTFAGRLDPKTTYAGLYWTYLANSGFYVDTVVQRSSYGGDARAANGNRVNIDGTGILASVETGYAVRVTDTLVIEPQAQVIAQGVSIDAVAIPNAIVRQKGQGQITGRLGLRARGRFETGAGAVQPYVRANLWKAFASTDRTLFDTPAATTVIATRNSALWGEAGAGLTWSLGSGIALYAEVDHRFSLDNGQGIIGHSTGGAVGLKFSL